MKQQSPNKIGKNRAESNGMWKGNEVSYGAIHDYIKYYLPKPERCQSCNQIKRLDLANISGEYKRDLSDWEWLCRKCHMTKDGRLSRLPSMKGKKLSSQTIEKRNITIRELVKLGIKRKPTRLKGFKLSQATKNKMAEARKLWWEKYYRGEVISKRYKNR